MKTMGIVVGALILVSVIAVVLLIMLRKRSSADVKQKDSKSAVLAADLKNEQAKSEAILASIDDGVALIDSQGTIQLFNNAAEKITGWPASDAIGLSHHSIIQILDEKGNLYTKEQNPLDRIFNEIATIHDNSGSLKTRSEKTTAIDISVSPLIGPNSAINGAVAIFRDVTQQRAEEKQRAEFISTASHEMRTPVAAIEGYLALALNEKVAKIDSKARDYLEKAHSSTQHLGSLFQDLLTAAKSEDGRLINHPTVVEMGSYLQEIVDGMRFTAEKKGLLLDFLLGSDGGQLVGGNGTHERVVRPLYYVYVDPERMREVITNLFDNAVKYTEQGKITVGLSGDDKIVQFRISDTGHGIAQEDIPHLFQKFYRVDNSDTRTIGGTGLGLFICKKIVEMYEGRIWIESEVGRGSTFFINLQRLSTDRANELMTRSSAAPGGGPTIITPSA